MENLDATGRAWVLQHSVLWSHRTFALTASMTEVYDGTPHSFAAALDRLKCTSRIGSLVQFCQGPKFYNDMGAHEADGFVLHDRGMHVVRIFNTASTRHHFVACIDLEDVQRNAGALRSARVAASLDNVWFGTKTVAFAVCVTALMSLWLN